jgi:hypothetical protein
LFKDCVLDDGVDDQHQSSTNTSIKASETFRLENMKTDSDRIRL